MTNSRYRSRRVRTIKQLFITCALLLCSAFFTTAIAQQAGARPFAIEAAGGTLGSAAGFGVALATFEDCGADNLECDIKSVIGAVALATIGSAAGAYLAGKLGDTKPSGLGATLGSVAGAAAGIGTWHLVREELNLATSDASAVAVYAVTQGIFAALGSRIGRALKT